MATLGIELCNAGFSAALGGEKEPRLLAPGDRGGLLDWPGFAHHDGKKFSFGRAAEDFWFVEPRQVDHVFWDKLSHEPSTLNVAGKPPSFSELAFYFLRDFTEQLAKSSGPLEKVVLAVPSAFLKDAATEEQKIGLLLGMAHELKLPLAGVVDMAAAALCDPRGGGFNPAHPVVVVDVHLSGADLTLHAMENGRLVRKDFAHLNPVGHAAILKHLTAAMGNRFLKATAFDILEDGHIEQAFFRQTKDFVLNGAPEHRYQLNTARRAYEMTGTHEQLVVDAQSFTTMILHGVQAMVQKLANPTEPVTVALTARTACLPGLESRLRGAGFMRLLRLPAGAAAAGAALIGDRLQVHKELDEVPVEISVPQSEVKSAKGVPWEANLQKARGAGARPRPTHVIMDGIGHGIGGNGGFTIGAPSACADLSLAEPFNAAGDCLVQLQRDAGRLWLVDANPAHANGATQVRTAVEAGDRLVVRCGAVSADLLFAHCHDLTGPRT